MKKSHKIGDAHTVKGIPCTVKYINNGNAWLFPVVDAQYDDGTFLMLSCALAMIDKKGKIVRYLVNPPAQSAKVVQ